MLQLDETLLGKPREGGQRGVRVWRWRRGERGRKMPCLAFPRVYMINPSYSLPPEIHLERFHKWRERAFHVYYADLIGTFYILEDVPAPDLSAFNLPRSAALGQISFSRHAGRRKRRKVRLIRVRPAEEFSGSLGPLPVYCVERDLRMVSEAYEKPLFGGEWRALQVEGQVYVVLYNQRHVMAVLETVEDWQIP